MPKLDIGALVLAAVTALSLSRAIAETYNCQVPQFNGPDRDANEKPWVVKDGTILLGYHGDLVPTPSMSFPIVKDNADQLVAIKYIKQSKGPDQTQILIIDKRALKVNFLLVLPGASYIEHDEGSCAKP
jgi:hypothetical protein